MPCFCENSPTGQTGQRIFALDGSNDADSCNGVPFWDNSCGLAWPGWDRQVTSGNNSSLEVVVVWILTRLMITAPSPLF